MKCATAMICVIFTPCVSLLLLCRCSLAGVDLNRQWKRPDCNLHPTIFAIKMLLRNERMAEREVLMFMDMHGHSRKHNIFCYGCDDKKKPRPDVRIYPKLLSWNRYEALEGKQRG